jgi:hypothetical protein
MTETFVPGRKLKRNLASLIGAFVVAAGVFVIFALLANDFGWTGPWPWIAAALTGAAYGLYVRLADL